MATAFASSCRKALFDPNNVEFDCVKTDVHSKSMSSGSRKQDVNTQEDNGYQSLMDPTQGTIPYASFSTRIVALMSWNVFVYVFWLQKL